MKGGYYLLLFLLLGLACRGADATVIQPFIAMRHFGMEDGLSCKTVYSIHQDKDGFMWFGTDQGAFRFDGKIFEHYSKQEGVADNEVFNIFQDSNNRIWFLTFNGGLSFWKDGVIHNKFNTNFLQRIHASSALISVYEDSKKDLWFGTQQAGFIVVRGDSAWRIRFPDENQVLRIPFVQEDEQHRIWSFRNNKLYRLQEENFRDSFPLRYNVMADRLWYDKKTGGLNYFSQEGLCNLSRMKETVHIPRQDVPRANTVITVVTEDSMTWICTSGEGCYEYVNRNCVNRFLPGKVVTNFYIDREGNKWFATMSEGLYMTSSENNKLVNFNHESGLSGEKIISVAVRDSTTWLGYENGIVDEMNGESLKSFTLRKGKDQVYVRVQNIIPEKSILCGTDIGIFSIEKNVVSFIPFTRDRNQDTVYSVKRLTRFSSDSIYSTSSFNLLRVLKDESGYYIQEQLDSIVRTFSIVTSGEHLIVSAMPGLMDFVPGKSFKPYVTDVDLSGERMMDMKSDAEGFLLMASSGNGLYILRNGKLQQHFDVSNGLPDGSCNRLLMDGNRCYLATTKGLIVFDKSNSRYSISRILTTKDGLLSNSVNDIAVNGGKLYIATDKGLSIVNYDETVPGTFFAPVIITGIWADSLININEKESRFQSGISRLSIRFSHPVFNAMHETAVQYRLLNSGSEKNEWILSRTNQVEFSSLPAGMYTLELKPEIENFPMGLTTRYQFEIVPPWYQTIFSKIIFVLLAGGLLILIVRKLVSARYEKNIRERALVENERNRIAADMHDDIGSDLTQISLLSNILKSGSGAGNDIAQKLARSSDDVLEKMDQIIWALNPVHDRTSHLVSYMHEYASQYLETAGIKFRFERSPQLPDIMMKARVRRNIFLIVKELLHNSVKHSEAKEVCMRMNVDESFLIFEYEDDGIGFTPASSGSGLGLGTMESRAKEIDASFTLDSLPGKGMKATFRIKL